MLVRCPKWPLRGYSLEFQPLQVLLGLLASLGGIVWKSTQKSLEQNKTSTVSANVTTISTFPCALSHLQLQLTLWATSYRIHTDKEARESPGKHQTGTCTPKLFIAAATITTLLCECKSLDSRATRMKTGTTHETPRDQDR